MKIHDFMNFHENHRKVKNVPAAAHRAQKLLIPMLFNRYFWPPEPESGKYGKKCHFHEISPIFMKMGENHLKSAIFTNFYHFGR